MWIFGFTYLVFKATYIDRGKPLREDAFFFTRRTLFPPLNKRNTRDKAKGLYITSERHIRGAGRAWVLLIGSLRIARMVSRREVQRASERVDFAEGFAPCW